MSVNTAKVIMIVKNSTKLRCEEVKQTFHDKIWRDAEVAKKDSSALVRGETQELGARASRESSYDDQEENRKYLISESCTFVVCSIIFTGYMDGQLAIQSDSKAQILKSGGTTLSQNSQEESKEALKNEIIFTDSDEYLISTRKKEPKRKGKGTDSEKDKIGMEVKTENEAGIPQGQEAQEKKSEVRILKGQESQVIKSGAGIPPGQESQVKKSDTGIPKRQESQVKKSGAGIPKRQESQVKKSETEIPKRQEYQVKMSEAGIPPGQESQVKMSEARIPKKQESQVKKSETEIPKRQESQVKKSGAGIPKRQEYQVKMSEAGIPPGQESQVKMSEVRIPKKQESQVKKSETEIPTRQESQ
ncbi:PREDICTED: uncharacterized protein C6orf10-like, partial [Galeopterus variegatus]|uniref:Uncharacterized protein C6orf10-like n=1 Tax=Galeopterus variegatus TaxID=482537 RepID=A0ABM0SBP2_GALVR